MLALLVFALFIAFLIYYFITKNDNYWKTRGVPYEKPYFFFGSFRDVVLRREHMLDRMLLVYNKHKTPYVGIHIFTRPYLFVKDVDMIKQILVKNFAEFSDRHVTAKEKTDPLAYHSLLMANSNEWRTTRKSVSPIFTSGKMKLMFPIVENCGKNLTDYLLEHHNEPLEIKRIIKLYAIDVTANCIFGLNSNCLDDEKSLVRKMAIQLMDLEQPERAISVFSYFFFPVLVDIFKLNFADKEAAYFFTEIFDKMMKERADQGKQRNDLIDLLHKLRETDSSDANIFDNFRMASQAVSFFSAGSETSTLTITFALYELALNRNIHDRLSVEIRAALGKCNGRITYDILQELKYLDMVVNETLRKYPVAIFLQRDVNKDFTFEKTGLTVEKGTSILIPVGGLHNDPQYFPKPDIFDPERFNDEKKDSIVPFTYLPFGEGPRFCIGSRFGLATIKIALIAILGHFTVHPCRKTEIPAQFDKKGILLQTKDMYLQLKKIN